MSSLSSKVRTAIRQPHKVPGRLRNKIVSQFRLVDATRIAWPEPGRAVLIDFFLPRPTGREVLVLSHATLISPGTERAFFNAQPNARPDYPYYPGYCGSGIVTDIGPGVTRFQRGDRVAGALPHASAMVFPEDQLAAVPDSATLDQAAFLRLGVIAAQGVRKAGIQLGERVAVIGQGLIGLLAMQFAAHSGAYPVIAVANSRARLPLAAQLGATETMALSEDAIDPTSIRADVTIDSTGNPQALPAALACTRDGGRIVLLGSNRGLTHGLDLGAAQRRGITLIGAHVDSLAQVESSPGRWTAEREARTFFAFVADGRLQIEPLISHEIFPPEAELFYRKLSRSDRSIVGGLLRWDRLPSAERLNGRWRDRLAPRTVSRSAVPASAAIDRPPPSGNGSDPHAPPVEIPAGQISGRVLRVGMIGCGEIALANARAVQEAGCAAITAVADVNASIAADMGRRYRVPHTPHVEELLRRDDVDAVLISVPHHLHAPLALQAAERGKHIMVEKPMATSVADADRMVEACRRAGVHLSVIYCQRYLPYVQRAKALLDQGALGRLLGIQLNFYMDKPPGYFTSGFSGRVETDWRLSREKSGGGILIFNLVHYLDIIRYLTGLEVVRAFAECGTLDTPIETEDSISVTLRYANGAIGSLTASSVARGAPYQPQLRLWGSEGQLSLMEPDRHTFYSLHQVDGLRPGYWHPLNAGVGGERREYVRRFADAVLNDRAPEVSGADGRAVQAIVQAIYASGERRSAVEVDRI